MVMVGRNMGLHAYRSQDRAYKAIGRCSDAVAERRRECRHCRRCLGTAWPRERRRGSGCGNGCTTGLRNVWSCPASTDGYWLDSQTGWRLPHIRTLL